MISATGTEALAGKGLGFLTRRIFYLIPYKLQHTPH